MISRCQNKLDVNSHPDDKDKLKALILNPETNQVDYNIICPFLKGLEGTFLPGKERLEFNKVFADRAGLLNADDFIKLLRQNNAINKTPISKPVKYFIKDNTRYVRDNDPTVLASPKIPATPRKSEFDYFSKDEDLIKMELVFIDRLEEPLKSNPSYTQDKPVESILEYFLNDSDFKVINTDRRTALIADKDYVEFLIKQCPTLIGYAALMLSEFYRNKCFEVFGYYDDLEWCMAHWGTRWNAIESITYEEDPLSVSFNSYNTPPIEWVINLANKSKEEGIRDFSATLKYLRAGDFGGTELNVSETGDYRIKDYDKGIELKNKKPEDICSL